MLSVKSVKKSVSINFENNLICKNCGVKTAVNWQHFNQQINQFMTSHKNCQHGDDVVSLADVAEMLGMSDFNFRNYSQKINMPPPLPHNPHFGRKKMFNRVEILNWLEANDIKKLIDTIRADRYRVKNPDAKPYVPKPQVSRAIKKEPEPKSLSLMQRFICGEFATSHQQIERRAKIEAAKANRPARLVLACFEDKDGDFVREFI